MATFFAKTWLLWYAIAAVIVMRWFHVAASVVESEVQIAHGADATTAKKTA